MVSATYYMSDDELRKEIYDLRRGLRKDIKEVRDFIRESKESGTSSSYPQFAIKDMAKMNTYFRKNAVSKMSRSELEKSYRRLQYIRGLDTSTKEGMISAISSMGKVWETLEKLTDEQKKKFWDLYKYSRQLNPNIDRYKYNFLNETVSEAEDIDDPEYLANRIDDLFFDLEKKKGGMVLNDDIIKFLSSDIHNIF